MNKTIATQDTRFPSTDSPPEALCIVQGDQEFQGYLEERTLNTINKMRLIRQSNPKCEADVCYYPCGGHDIICPTVLTNAREFILTGAKPWGTLSPPTLGGAYIGDGGERNFDFFHPDQFENEDAGYLSVRRLNAINAYQTGRTKDIHACPFNLDASGQISFFPPELGQTYSNMALFCDGRAYYFFQIALPGEAYKTASLHNFLSRQVSTPITMIEKAILMDVFQEAGCLDLFRPNVPCQAVITDCVMGTDEMQPIYIQGLNVTRGIELISNQDPKNELREPGFGYGSKVFIATSEDRTKTSLAATVCAKICDLLAKKENRLVNISDHLLRKEKNMIKRAIEKERAKNKKEIEDRNQREMKAMDANMDRNRLTLDANPPLNSTLTMPKSKRLTSSEYNLATYKALTHRLTNKIGDDPLVPILVYQVWGMVDSPSKSLDELLNCIPGSWKVKYRISYERSPGTFNSLYIPQSKIEEFKTFQRRLPQGYTTHKVQPGDSMATLIHSSYHNKNKVSKALFQGCVVLSHPSGLGNKTLSNPLLQNKGICKENPLLRA